MEEMKIVWSRDALQDLDEAHGFICKEDSGAAARTIGRIEVLLESLAIHPKLGRIGRVKGTRELVVSGTAFILPYVIDKKRIIILGVRHAKRRWPKGFEADEAG